MISSPIGEVLSITQVEAGQATPSMGRSAGGEAPFELKFLVDEDLASKIAGWAAGHLRPDPHSDPEAGATYRVTSLYLDTPGLDVYRRRGSHGRAKFRVRRYDNAASLFLERKCKVKGQVRKRRSFIPEGDLQHLMGSEAGPGWVGRWFHRRVAVRGLAPTCLVSYHRIARLGDSLYGPIRLTIDRDFACRPQSQFQPPRIVLGEGSGFFEGRAVVELKYRVTLPPLFKQLMGDLGLSPEKASKYRSAIETCGLAPAAVEPSGGSTHV